MAVACRTIAHRDARGETPLTGRRAIGAQPNPAGNRPAGALAKVFAARKRLWRSTKEGHTAGAAEGPVAG